MSGLTGDWDRIDAIFNSRRIDLILKTVGEKIGNYGVSEVKKGIVSGAPGGKELQPLSPLTIARKGSSKPLIDKGGLLNSISYKTVGGDKVFIGVQDKEEAKIAAIHEYGCTIPVTPKLRAYFHYQGIHLRSETVSLHIPPRKFLRPVLESEKFQKSIIKICIEALRSVFS